MEENADAGAAPYPARDRKGIEKAFTVEYLHEKVQLWPALRNRVGKRYCATTLRLYFPRFK